jgi:hypothetical protein
MSSLERNKGRLCCVGTVQDFQGSFTSDEFMDFLEKVGMLEIDGNIYVVNWEVKAEVDDTCFAEVNEDEDGLIHFHTIHYNGGGSLEEVLANAMHKGVEIL